ncbi:hypothetical protein [Thiomicrorhabdus sp.]|uniref:hypothetical protein n=1 Tax=Thiomicrorhabdus sp. TaxID=2039724 RepID=UPI00356A78F2
MKEQQDQKATKDGTNLFEGIVFPDYFIQKNLSFDDMIGSIRTWSAYKKAKEKGELKAFEAFFERMKKSWGNPVNAKKVTWPISVRAGRVHRNSPP